MRGFTLFELLIAMLLTAVIGMVMFKTWDLVVQSGAQAQKAVDQRERERIVFGIIDNDIASLILKPGEDSTLPELSREEILPSDEFYETMGRKKESQLAKGTVILLSFAGTNTLGGAGPALGFPVCVQYVLRGSGQKYDLIRRERAYCGVSGDFPWSEAVLLEDLREASMELVFRDGTRQEKWTSADLDNAPLAIRLKLRKYGDKEEETEFPLFERREEIGWEEKTFQ